jgi:hypothetical protein
VFYMVYACLVLDCFLGRSLIEMLEAGSCAMNGCSHPNLAS